LKLGLAMTLCGMANKLNKRRSTAMDSAGDNGDPVSIDFGTTRLPTKPMA
jgi:hypothetical protein